MRVKSQFDSRLTIPALIVLGVLSGTILEQGASANTGVTWICLMDMPNAVHAIARFLVTFIIARTNPSGPIHPDPRSLNRPVVLILSNQG